MDGKFLLDTNTGIILECLRRASNPFRPPTRLLKSLPRYSGQQPYATAVVCPSWAATRNSGMTFTLARIDSEIRHEDSALSMMVWARSASALVLSTNKGLTVNSVNRYLPSARSSTPSISLSYDTSPKFERRANAMKVCIRQALTVAAKRSSGDQYSGLPPNSGGLEVARSGLPLAEMTPCRPVFQLALLRNLKTL